MDVATVTTSDGSLPRSVRETLRDADDAILCVALASMAGVRVGTLEPGVRRERARGVVLEWAGGG